MAEHAKNQGKINIENGIDDKVLDQAKGSAGDSKLAVSDMAAVPSIPSKYPVIPQTLPKNRAR